MVRAAAVLLAVILVGQWGAAAAQAPTGEPSAEDLAEARSRFVSGSAAAQEGRWADAAVDFERAYALSSAPPALFNLAVALRGLGRYLEARRALDLLLARHRAELEPTMLSDAERIRGEVAERVASLELSGLDRSVRYEVRLDGQPLLDEGERPWIVETDPGTHHLTAMREGFEPFAWDARLDPGQRQIVRVSMEPLPTPVLPHAGSGADGRARDEEGGGIFSSPVFWVVTTLVLAGAGVGAYLFFTADDGLEPESNMPVRVP